MFDSWDEIPLWVYDHCNMTVERRIGPEPSEPEFPSILEGTY